MENDIKQCKPNGRLEWILAFIKKHNSELTVIAVLLTTIATGLIAAFMFKANSISKSPSSSSGS